MKPVGYLWNTKYGLEGEAGSFYNYIVAANGIFVRAESKHIEATVCVAGSNVRGLAPLKEEVHLAHGKIPEHLYDVALLLFSGDPFREHYLAVTWDGQYKVSHPVQDISGGGVKYEVMEGTVLDIHSHGSMGAWFSSVDNADELGLKLYGVVGEVHTMLPDSLWRVGIYGYFCPLEIGDIFDV